MIIKEICDIDIILPIHKEIFGNDFPILSYYKKCLTNNLYIFVYEENNVIMGYSIIVDQADEKNLYAWYGGVLPEFQGNGITKLFFEKLILFAKEKEYVSITLATSNIRPHMIALAVKMGFDIVDIKKRETGEGNKIYFKYKIASPCTEELYFEKNGEKITLVQIEEKLVRAYKNNCTELIINWNGDFDALRYTINYCNSFARRPKILIKLSHSANVSSKIFEVIGCYKGNVEIFN